MAKKSVLSYANSGAIRNRQLTPRLSSRLIEAVTNVYGEGYTAQVYSGGQPAKGTKGRRTGSIRHDLGRAADVYIIGPDGKRVTGDALAPLGQYWAARKYGGVGLEMNGGGIHLDEWSRPPPGGGMSWNYGHSTPEQRRAVKAGLSGQMPKGKGMAALVGNRELAYTDEPKPAAGVEAINAMSQPRKRVKVTDPAILGKLNAAAPKKRVKVTDPALLDKLNGAAKGGYEPGDAATSTPEGAQFLDRMIDKKPMGGAVAGSGGGILQSIDSFGRGFADAASFGTADEAAAGMGAATGVGGKFGDYSGNLEQQRAIDAQRGKENPYATLGGQIAGGVSAGVLAAPVAAGNYLGRIWQGAKLGAAGGAAYGFGSGEGIEDRALGAVKGGAVGAALGGAIPFTTGAISKGYNAVMDATVRPGMNALRSTVNPSGNAQRLVQRSLARDNLTPAAAAGKMQSAIAAGDDTTMLVDVAGDNTRRLARFATNIPGQGAEKIKGAVFDRQLAQPERVIDAVRKGLDDPARYFGTVDNIIEQRQAAAKPLYDKAFNTPVPFTKKLEGLLGRGKVMRDALRKARDMGEAEGIPSKSFFANIADDGSYTIQSVPDARQWDLMKRSLDDVIEAEKTVMPNGTEKLSNMGRIVAGIKREMLEEVDKYNPDYAAARKVYSSASDSLDAVTKGKNLLDADPELARRMLKDMSEGDKQLARLGVSKALTDRIEKVKDGANTVRAIFASPKHRKVLKEIFPDEKSFDDFKDAMEREAQKTRTKNAVTGNSTTAQQLTDIADNQMDMGTVGNLLAGRPVAAIGSAIQKAMSRAVVVNEATAKEIADILTTSDPGVAAKVIAEMQRAALKDQRVAKNLGMVMTALRRGAINVSTQRTTEALSGKQPRVLGQQARKPLEITVTP